ncbi:PEP-CTERM sorting domain-containing protein [Rubritalea marina]|uniref:PEP-CTERM sorting domain-containing protein n=1 Tax=Rubritalea marina TaxID=361055 RepID=UPI000382ACB4|nr:PEP-CTERM sorting domain-containing protein [Rubritalea marina]
MKPTHRLTGLALAIAGLPIASTQAAILLQDDFSTPSTPTDQFRAYEARIDLGWNGSRTGGNLSEWDITGGRLENAYAVAGDSVEGESPAWQWWTNTATTSTDTILTVSFDYGTDGSDSLEVHFWAIQSGATPTTTFDFLSNTSNWRSGNSSLNEDVSAGGYDTFNLLDGDTTPDDEDSISGSLSGTGTFTWQVDVSTLGIAGVSTVGDIDGFFFGLGADETGGGTSYIDNLSITSVPEPSSTALLGLGASVLLLRRRR